MNKSIICKGDIILFFRDMAMLRKLNGVLELK